MNIKNLYTLAFVTLFSACSSQITVPTEAVPTKEQAQIFPDYRDVVIPPNIAPLNFQIKNEASAFVATLSSDKIQIAAEADKNGTFTLDSAEWKQLLETAKGQQIEVQLYAESKGNWIKYPSYQMSVAKEPIDRFLSYRLIEPGYELYRQMGLYQRDLENFEEHVIYENNREFDTDNNHCVNCHNYQAGNTDRMLFHVRAKHGGTVIIKNGKAERLTMSTDSTAGNAVYPTWHPKKDWVVFSTNKTGQAFHVKNKDKVEVVDYGSDLLFYDAEKHTISNILKTDDTFETFPCWAPDGKKLYYCSAYMPEFKGQPDSVAMDLIVKLNREVRYDIMSLNFDETTRTFGTPVLEVACASEEKSASVPRISPDGKYLLFTKADFGQFHIWHHSSDQWIKNLETGEIYPLTAANSSDVDSYHTWSSNSRWIIFASRRLDGQYSRAFIAYIDKKGQAHKAFLLPQVDPKHNTIRLKSYNVPELSKNRVSISPDALKEVIYNDTEAQKVFYKSLK